MRLGWGRMIRNLLKGFIKLSEIRSWLLWWINKISQTNYQTSNDKVWRHHHRKYFKQTEKTLSSSNRYLMEPILESDITNWSSFLVSKFWLSGPDRTDGQNIRSLPPEEYSYYWCKSRRLMWWLIVFGWVPCLSGNLTELSGPAIVNTQSSQLDL